jgi:hypothetical protein
MLGQKWAGPTDSLFLNVELGKMEEIVALVVTVGTHNCQMNQNKIFFGMFVKIGKRKTTAWHLLRIWFCTVWNSVLLVFTSADS